MTVRKLIFSSVSILLMGVLVAIPLTSQVSAVTSTVDTQARCTLVTTRIDLITKRYQNNKDAYVQKHQNAKERVAKLVDLLESKGYNVTKLRADLEVWDVKIKAIGTQFMAFMDALNKTKQYACGQSQGDFKASLLDARDQLAKVRQAALDARLYYQNTIRPDLQDLRNQKKQ